MAENSSGRLSFWTTLPGVLTGIAAIVSAGAGVYALTKDGDDPPASAAQQTASATHDEWVRRANAICDRKLARIERLTIETPEDLPPVVRIARSARDEIGAIPVASADREQVARYLELLDRAATDTQDAVEVASTGDIETAETIARRAEEVDGQASDAARDLGAFTCAQDPSIDASGLEEFP